MSVFAQAVWDKLWGKQSQLADSTTVKINKTSRGITLKAAASIGGAGGSQAIWL